MKACSNKVPTARITIHSPSLGWRPHRDATTKIKADTDLELFTKIVANTLSSLGYDTLRDEKGQQPFVVGFLLDMLNRLPLEIRKVVAVGIMQGWGMEVHHDPLDGITVRNVPRYPAVVGEKKTESGLILP